MIEVQRHLGTRFPSTSSSTTSAATGGGTAGMTQSQTTGGAGAAGAPGSNPMTAMDVMNTINMNVNIGMNPMNSMMSASNPSSLNMDAMNAMNAMNSNTVNPMNTMNALGMNTFNAMNAMNMGMNMNTMNASLGNPMGAMNAMNAMNAVNMGTIGASSGAAGGGGGLGSNNGSVNIGAIDPSSMAIGSNHMMSVGDATSKASAGVNMNMNMNMNAGLGNPISADMLALMQAQADLAKMQSAMQANGNQMSLSKFPKDATSITLADQNQQHHQQLAMSSISTTSPLAQNGGLPGTAGLSGITGPNGNGMLSSTMSQLDQFNGFPLQAPPGTSALNNVPSAGNSEIDTNSNDTGHGNKRSFHDMSFSSAGGAKPQVSLPSEQPYLQTGNGKKPKKGKKPSDMPRRALSAYNIFFSEQRELILKEIDAKENGGDKTKSKSSSACDASLGSTPTTADDEVSKDKKAGDDSTDGSSAAERPSVLNRTFFPKRTKRPHRKVHGKIGLVALARTVSKRWKELADDKRKYYQDLAAEDKKRHKQAMIDYKERKAAQNMLAAKAAETDGNSSSASNAMLPLGPQGASVSDLGLSNNGGPAMISSNGIHSMAQQQQQNSNGANQSSAIEQHQQRLLAEMMGTQWMNNMRSTPGIAGSNNNVNNQQDFQSMIQQQLNAFGNGAAGQAAGHNQQQQQLQFQANQSQNALLLGNGGNGHGLSNAANNGFSNNGNDNGNHVGFGGMSQRFNPSSFGTS